jgi:hypothetical protein
MEEDHLGYRLRMLSVCAVWNVRYSSDPAIIPLLPGWIAGRVVPHERASDFGKAFVELSSFFRARMAANQLASP